MFTWNPFRECSGKEVEAVKNIPVDIRAGIPLVKQLIITSTKNCMSCC
jgi:hypothetical protein